MKNNKMDELNSHLNIVGKISRFFAQRIEMAVLLIMLTIIIGILSYSQLPKESLPEIVFPSITVSTVYPGASPEDVESLVTEVLEASINGIEDVADIYSQSGQGLSVITVAFVEGVDMEEKNDELKGLLSEVQLPEGTLDPEALVFKTSEIPLISFSLVGGDLIELTSVSEAVADQLLKVDGVEAVNVFGGLEKEIQVIIDLELMKENGLSIEAISDALAVNNFNIPLGDTIEGSNRLNIRVDESITSIEQLEGVVITSSQGESLQISDIASVVEGSKEVTSFNRTFTGIGSPENSIFIEVIRQNKKDVLGTSEQVKATMNSLKGSMIPLDVEVIVSRDTANQVEEDLDNVLGNALSGLIVVVLVLFLFIGFKEALIVAITIPLTLLATLGTLSLFGITLNTFAILGLIVALGLLVDNTIIVMENMDRLKKKGATPMEAAIYGTNQVGFPITAATMTTVAAFLPLAILPGVVGAFINTIPRTIIITLVLSLVLAIAITPAVYVFVNKLTKEETVVGPLKSILLGLVTLSIVGGLSWLAFYGEGLWIGIPIIGTLFFLILTVIKLITTYKSSDKVSGIIRLYESSILKLVQSKLRMAMVLLIAFAVLTSSILLLTSEQLKIAFFPQTEPSSLTINVGVPKGQSLEKASEIIGQVEAILAENNFVDRFNTTIGGRDLSSGVIVVDLKVSDVSGFEQLEDIRDDIESIEGAKITIEANAAGGPPVGKPIEIKLRSQDLLASQQTMTAYVEALKEIDGVYNVEESITDGGELLVIDVDNQKATEIGVNGLYVVSKLRNYSEGIISTRVKDQGSLIDVRVMTDLASFDDLLELDIMTPRGQYVEVSELISVSKTTGVSGITRENGQRTITVTADLEKGYNASETIDILKDTVNKDLVDESVLVDFDGEAADISESFGELLQSMVLAVFLVFMILTVQFASIKQPFIIISTVPMALIGVLYGLTITGNEFGFYAFMALVSLVGIAVNDAIVLIDYMNYLRKTGTPFYEAIAKAGRTRFNPVLATTMTTIGGILPLSFKNAYYAQFGFALIFGLLVTTMLTLVIIPVIYSIMEGSKVRAEFKRNQQTNANRTDKRSGQGVVNAA